MMDASTDYDWKKKVGFPINYNSDQSSDDDFDPADVVVRNPMQSSGYLLADGGDGSEADLLGTTPPRSRIRNKEKRRTIIDSGCSFQRLIKEKRDTVDSSLYSDQNSPVSDRLKKRSSLKLIRAKERDWKQDMSRDSKADSLPSPTPAPTVPTLLNLQVESCSRFMSLTSRPKCRETQVEERLEDEVEERWRGEREQLPPSRVNFHKTFSMLINMGNIDKGCRRTMSHEEQVWQNELKDLVWLELQARLAGRTLAQQDAYLCTQRNIVPTLIKNISNYRFVNRNPCRNKCQRLNKIQGSSENLDSEHNGAADQTSTDEDQNNSEDAPLGCLVFECPSCSEAVGAAMREASTLLEAFYNAMALYPSSKAMMADHPLIATQPFQNRLKALCLWFNTALNMRLKLVAVRRMLRSMRLKGERRGAHRASLDSNISRQSSETHRPSHVRFNVGNNPTDSSNSDSSDVIKEEKDSDEVTSGEEKRESDDQEAGGRHSDDEVDSGIGSSKCNGQTTPEIVVDGRYGTDDTSVCHDSESPTESTISCSQLHADAVDLGPLAELTQLKLLDRTDVSLYREYHCEILKTQGVRRCMKFICKTRVNVLQKVYMTLEKPDNAQSATLFAEDEPTQVFDDSKPEEEKTETAQHEADKNNYELRRYGCWSEENRSMRLPSYRSHFLLLSSICMEAIHDYLSFRLETTPEHPSCLTVKQLMHELKEGLDIAAGVRADFVRDLEATLAGRGAGPARQDLLLLVATYDRTVEAVLKQYLSYMRTMSVTEQMPRSSLQAEWRFAAGLARRLRCAALLAPPAFADMACNQLNRLVEQFGEEFAKIKAVDETDHPESDSPSCEEHISGLSRHAIYAVCRMAQGVYADSREAILVAAQWARALAARLARAPPPAYLPQRERIFDSLFAVRNLIVEDVRYILEKSELGPGEEWPKDMTEGVSTRVRELLLQVFKLGFELDRELYKFARAPFKLAEERALRRVRPSSLQPPRRHPLETGRRRPETVLIHESFNPLIHKELHRFVNDPGLNRSSSFARKSISSPPKARTKFMRSDSVIEDYEASVFDDKLFDNFGENQTQSGIEALLAGAAPGGEPRSRGTTCPAGGVASEEKEWAGRAARAIVQFAACWMDFVVKRCDRGRGTRPRWACQGLEFLMLACDPCNTQYLSDEEFEDLKQQMDSCISHVIGSRPLAPRPSEHVAPATSPRPRHRLHSPLSTPCANKDVPTPPTPPSEPEPLLSFPGPDSRAHASRVAEAVARVEAERESRLRAAKGVGRVVGAVAYEPKLRQLTFRWQRGLKIGAGSFGKVYTVVNTASGQLLAMKELAVGAGDRRALSRAANELRVLEGVLHPHLVRYYGCELHRDEMLLFMELCVEGSLEALLAAAGALPELTVRRYAKQLVSAVTALHERNVAHRDIKSGNIFLTNEGHCLKLGDFGCAVKIRAHTTAPGELQGFVGTQAYMAPEVFMKASGHGRAADVWSLGCVVAEMGSGKRPFSEADYSNYQIMFMVGMGGRPEIPETLSEEGRQFCLSCLTHDPELRPRAEALSLHHFLMVKSDDDCKCEPAFML